ncbi:MAG: SURF1 family protein [Chloroflexi bacterium]|nr:SURF1 family protein [Chloroflexota bacterium]
MKQISLIFRALFTRHWLGPTVAVLAGMIFLSRLGFWQMDRLDQRRAANEQLVAALDQVPIHLPIEELPQEIVSLKNRNVVVSGTYDYEHEGLLILQNREGRSGVHLLTPLVLEGGETAVLVNRGWIPDADANAEARIQYELSGNVVINGYVGLTQTLQRDNVANASPVRGEDEWYRVDVDAFAAQLPYELYPFYITESPLDDEAVELPYQIEQEVDLSEGSHLSYALQWFLFSLMLGITYLIYVNKDVTKDSGKS